MIETTMMIAEPVTAKMKMELYEGVRRFKTAHGFSPKLVALLIGHDPISRTYVELKARDAGEVGILSEVIDLSVLPKGPDTESRILEQIEKLNKDDKVSAVIPQMPFDGMISEEKVFSTLIPGKDVDGLTPFRLGKLIRREYSLENSILPCTPKGAMLLMKHYGVELKGAIASIVGRSILVGEPLRKMMQDSDATATCYHTNSKNLYSAIKEADVVVAASGRPPEMYGGSGFRLTGEMLKHGGTVIGIGVRKDTKTNKMLFDVDTKSLKGIASFLTPNTGGIGAMTRAVLMQNTLIAANELKL